MNNTDSREKFFMEIRTEEQYVEELLSQLTLEEKIGMIHGAGLFRTEGVERLEIPPLYMSDGPMGVRAEFADKEWRSVGETDDFVTYLPCNSAIASTWNTKLAERMGEVLGEEARGRGKDVILAPGINIKRSPLCGRNFEYMSEDPRLIEELAVPMIQGIQKSDVAACVKHFAANSQETERLFVDTKVDERTLQEIYFPGFKAAVEKGGTFSLMGAYNLLNGEHCCTSKHLLNQELREKWKFDGVIVSDWGGVHDTDLAANSALDIEMDVTYKFDDHFMANPLLKKIKSGDISEELITEKVRNILHMMLRLKMIGIAKEERKSGAYNTAEHVQATLETARESIILLKNEEKSLPLDKKTAKKVAVIGANAVAVHSNGGGSAEIKALYEISPLMGIKKLLGGNAKVAYAPGYVIPKKEGQSDVNWQADSTKHIENSNETVSAESKEEQQNKMEAAYLKEAVSLAKESDIVIFVGGLNHDYDVEGFDRNDMRLPYKQDMVLDAVLEANPDTVVVMYAGSPVEMPWLDKVKTLVWSYYAGMEGGTALAEVLFGEVNPSGKLAETFIEKLEQCPAKRGINFARTDCVEYTEGVMVGYRYYDSAKENVNFCFGHGLSYTTFAYKNIAVEKQGDAGYAIRATIQNQGEYAGKEIVQVYVAPKEMGTLVRPCHELKAFEKISLEPGEEKTVTFTLEPKDFSCYAVEKKEFVVVKGDYDIEVGASSRDIRLKEMISI